MSTSNCLFCKIVDGQIPAKIAYQDDKCLAFHDINPQAPTHILVIPLEHIASLKEATSLNNELLGHLLTSAAKIANDLGIAEEGFRTVINTGALAGQTVFHIHIHILGGRGLAWPPG
ncbi:MAG: histidine triad nucleotide-binding protein [Acidobacteria bacterium]|nr:histidine triad nucleotide-binding protein [Acidobacteriota bacterium]